MGCFPFFQHQRGLFGEVEGEKATHQQYDNPRMGKNISQVREPEADTENEGQHQIEEQDKHDKHSPRERDKSEDQKEP